MLRLSLVVALVATAAVAAIAAPSSAPAAPPDKYGRLVYVASTTKSVQARFRTPGTRVQIYYTCKGDQDSEPFHRLLDPDGIGLKDSLECDGRTHQSRWGTGPDGHLWKIRQPGATYTLSLAQSGATVTSMSVWGLKY